MYCKQFRAVVLHRRCKFAINSNFAIYVLCGGNNTWSMTCVVRSASHCNVRKFDFCKMINLFLRHLPFRRFRMVHSKACVNRWHFTNHRIATKNTVNAILMANPSAHKSKWLISEYRVSGRD